MKSFEIKFTGWMNAALATYVITNIISLVLVPALAIYLMVAFAALKH